jgi:hypothetical protein
VEGKYVLKRLKDIKSNFKYILLPSIYQTFQITSGIFPDTNIGALYLGKKNSEIPLRAFSIDLAYFCHLKECIFSVKIAFLDGEPGCQTQF